MSNRKTHWWQDDYGDWNGFAIVGVTVAIVLALVALSIAAAFYAEKQGCTDRGNAYGLETEYSFWANTCFAQLNGHTVNIEGIEQNARGQIIYLEEGSR